MINPPIRNEVLVRVDSVSKKYCRSLKRSLWYAVRDIGSELNPFSFGNGNAKHGDGRSAGHNGNAGATANQSGGSGDVTATIPLRKHEFWAVRDVSFELRRGECLGLIGHNAAGKSTLLKMLNGIIKPDTGRIEMWGRIGAMIELGAGFNPILTGRENIYSRGAVLGFRKREIDEKFDQIVAFAEAEEFLEMPVQNYSSGMKVRLGFAINALMDPDVLIIDEVLAVGDVGFIVKCLNRIAELLPRTAVLFVSHSMPWVARICTLAMLMNGGRVQYFGRDVPDAITQYLEHFAAGRREDQGSGEVVMEEVRIGDQVKQAEPDRPFPIHQNGARFEVLVRFKNTTDRTLRFHAFINVVDRQLREAVNCLSKENCDPWEVKAGQQLALAVRIRALYLNRGVHSLTIGAMDAVTHKFYCRTTNAVSFMVQSKEQGLGTSVVPGEWCPQPAIVLE